MDLARIIQPMVVGPNSIILLLKVPGSDYVPLEGGPAFTGTRLEGELAKVNNSGDAAAYNENASNNYTQGE